MAGILLFTRVFAISVWVEANGIEPLAIFISFSRSFKIQNRKRATNGKWSL